MRDYILAIDQGTTGTTALMVDRDGVVRGRGYARIPQHYPEPGWVEHDPLEIWKHTCQAISQAKHDAEIDDPGIAAISLANQRENDHAGRQTNWRTCGASYRVAVPQNGGEM